MNMPMSSNGRPLQGVQAPHDIPLASAAWQRSGVGAIKTCELGDVFLGYDQDGKSVAINDDRHIALDGATRGGKGASVIVQNLILWPGSCVVIDPKGENAMLTARRRGHGSAFSGGARQTVRILDPFNAVHTELDDFRDLKVSFNPLDVLRVDREESVDDAARIAEAMIVLEANEEPFWVESARIALKGIILYVATDPSFGSNERNLNTVRTLIMQGDTKAHALAVLAHGHKKAPSPFDLLFAAMRRTKALDGVIANAGGMLANLAGDGARTLAGIMQTVRTNTEFLDSPGIKRCVARSDFSLSELKTNPTGATLYLCLPQRFVETHYRWLRMMVTLTITEMEQKRGMPACGHRVLMVLDEFPALRRMRIIENAAAQIAGFGVKLMFVTQTLAQLKDLYKDNWETLLANAAAKLFFCIEDNFTREYVSKLIGDHEVIRTARNASGTHGQSTTSGSSFTSGTSSNAGYGRASEGSSTSSGASSSRGESSSTSAGLSESIQKRPLITPDEVGRLFGDRDNPTALALISGHQPLFLRRKYYFRDPDFAGFYDPHPDHPLPLTIAQANAAREQLALQERYEQQARWERAQARRQADAEAWRMRRQDEMERQEREALERERRDRAWEKKERARLRESRLLLFGIAVCLVVGVVCIVLVISNIFG